MNRKKLLSALLVLSLLFSLLPTAALAKTESFSIEGPRVSSVRTRAAAQTPALSSGNHASYMDRVAAMPDYAKEFYRWMEENSGPDGILVDPTKATEDNGEYYYAVHYTSGSEKFTFTSKDEMLATGSNIAASALEKEFNSFSLWTGVVHDVFDREHPEVFWLSGHSSVSYLGGWSYSTRGNTCTIYYEADLVVWLKYPGFDIRASKYTDVATLKKAINNRDNLVNDILADCPQGSDYDRVGYLNDTLTARNAYNSAVGTGKSSKADSDAWECISALTGKSGTGGPVCEGYARAFQVLCNKLNIPCVLVDGTAISFLNDEPEEHMWNYVQLDGGWYAIDVTWNDPFITSKPDVKNSGKENRKWFLLGSDSEVDEGLTFKKSHEIHNQIRADGLRFTNGPVLEKTEFNPNSTPLYSIGGKIKTGSADNLTLELSCNGAVVATQSISGKSAEYTFENIGAGTYQMKLSKPDHVPYTQELTVTDEAVTFDFTLRLLGDVTGDGRINVGDVARIYGHIKKTSVVTDPYILLVVDVTGEGRINVGDTARLYGRIKG